MPLCVFFKSLWKTILIVSSKIMRCCVFPFGLCWQQSQTQGEKEMTLPEVQMHDGDLSMEKTKLKLDNKIKKD